MPYTNMTRTLALLVATAAQAQGQTAYVCVEVSELCGDGVWAHHLGIVACVLIVSWGLCSNGLVHPDATGHRSQSIATRTADSAMTL